MPHEFKAQARTQVLEALSGVVAINPELAAGVVMFITMIDGSVLTLFTCCCPVHASVVCEVGLSQAMREVGENCPRQG